MAKKPIIKEAEPRKIFILDTSVLIYDPKAYESFRNNDVIIPITVLDELDKVKKYSDGGGRHARVAIRNLDTLSDLGEIHLGIQLPNDISLKIDTSIYGSIGIDPTYGDNKLLACAAKVKETNAERQVVLVSKDINLRTRAKAFGLCAKDYENDKIDYTDLYDGFRIVEDTGAAAALNEAGVISAKEYDLLNLNPYECVNFVDKNGKGLSSGKFIAGQIKLIKEYKPWGLDLLNREQLYAADLMMDKNISLVSIIGNAGSGKTLVSLACALEQVLNKRTYDRLVLYRPIQVMGNDVGFLPGGLQEKLDPYFGPIDDSFSFLFSDRSKSKDGWKAKLFQYLNNGTIQKEALSFIRGRSIGDSILLVDECQNLSKDEVKTILTRVGIGSKIIMTGDISQIDALHLDATNNGLSHTIEKFKSSELAAHITFKRGERSKLATLASEIL